MAKQGQTSIRVLAIDDDATMRSIIGYQLGEMGIEDVVEAANGKKAVELLRDPNVEVPDVILCDLHMEEMDGLQFCNLLRMDEELKSAGIPVIIVTADGENLTHEVAAQAVLTKPFATQKLQQCPASIVGFEVGVAAQ